MVRVKHRYILVQIKCNNLPPNQSINIDSNTITSYLRKEVEKFFGEFAAASLARLNIIYLNAKTHLCIIQTRHGPHRFITATLPLLTLADKESARYRTLYVGATLEQCHKFIVKFQQRYINKHIGEYRGMIQRQKFIEEVNKLNKM